MFIIVGADVIHGLDVVNAGHAALALTRTRRRSYLAALNLETVTVMPWFNQLYQPWELTITGQ